jgi:hypothetical protein
MDQPRPTAISTYFAKLEKPHVARTKAHHLLDIVDERQLWPYLWGRYVARYGGVWAD